MANGIKSLFGEDNPSIVSSPASLTLQAATPALLGLLTGDARSGFEVSANVLEKEKENRDALSLMEAKIKAKMLEKQAEAKSPASKRRFKFGTYEGPDGKVYKTKEDTFTGDIEYTKDLAGYKPWMGRNPVTKEIGRSSVQQDMPIRQTTTQGVAPSRLTINEEEDMEKMQKRFTADKRYTNAVDFGSKSSLALQSLSRYRQDAENNPNGVLAAAIQTSVARMFDKGALSDVDRAQYKGDPSLMSAWERLYDKAVKGQMTGRDFNQLLGTVEAVYDFSQGQIEDLADRYSRKFKRDYGFDPELGDLYGLKKMDRPRKMPETPKNLKGKPSRRQRVIQNGNIFEKQSNGEYKFIGKQK